MPVASTAFEGGFADPVLQSQSVFRAVMDAMARPGSIQPVGAPVAPPAPLSPAAAAVLSTLADADTGVWLDPPLARAGAVRSWLSFQTGAPLAADLAEAAFAVFADPSSLPGPEAFALGSQEYPDRSASLVLQVETLDDGTPLLLSGPGMAETSTIAPAPLPRGFGRWWQANHAIFPRGVDIILAATDRVACLPRTVRIELPEG